MPLPLRLCEKGITDLVHPLKVRARMSGWSHDTSHLLAFSKFPIGDVDDVMSRTYQDYNTVMKNLPMLAGVLRASHGGLRWPLILMLQGTLDLVVPLN
jgi:hypothetical protein